MNSCKKLFLLFFIFLTFGVNAGVVEDKKMDKKEELMIKINKKL